MKRKCHYMQYNKSKRIVNNSTRGNTTAFTTHFCRTSAHSTSAVACSVTSDPSHHLVATRTVPAALSFGRASARYFVNLLLPFLFSTMSVNRKAGGAWKETRHDKWYNLAKEQGYRSRAAFKLIQLNKKYNLLSAAKSVLDLGAAPGGWLQVCSRYMPVSSLLLGVDLLPIKPMRGVTTIQADITTAECKTLIKKELQGWDVDLVLCDGAPNVAGGTVWSKDAYQQNELVIHALRLATHFMRPNANFVTKVFRSQDYNALLWVLGQLFRHVDVTKPLASRNASAEIFVVCREYLAPKRIDPFLLDPAHVFQQFEGSEPKQRDVFHQKPGKTERSRQGYEDSETHSALLGKQADITVFVDSDQPIVALGSYGRFVWDSDRAKGWRQWSASTTEEVVELSKDLKVLGKGDLKALLRWRKKVRDFEKQLKKEQGVKDESEQKAAEAAAEVEKTEEQRAEEEEADMTAAIRELKQREEQRKKLDKRRKRDMKNKLTRRLLLNKNNLSDVQEMIGADVNDELFSLASVQPMVMDVLERKAGEEVEERDGEASSSDGSDSERSEDEGSEEDEAEEQYMSRLEKDLDRMFDAYQQRRKLVENLKDKADAQLKADEVEAMEADKEEDDEDEEREESDEELYEAMRERRAGEKSVTTDGEDEEKSNPLLVKLTEKEKITAANRMERWFGRDVFGSLEEESKVAEQDEVKQPQVGVKRKRSLSDMLGRDIAMDSSDDNEDEEEEDGEDEAGSRWLGEDGENEDGEERLTRKQRAELRGANKDSTPKPLIGLDALSKTREQAEADQKAKDKRAKKNTREERRLQRKVDEELQRSSEGQEEEDDGAHMLVDQDSAKKAKRMKKRLDKLRGVVGAEADGGFETVAARNEVLSSDDEATATTLAIAHRMLDKKNRTDILNNSYNRYSIDVSEQRHLPAWFKQEEVVHMQAQLPVTKAEVDEYKQRLMAINAKPIKKIAEARARNRVKAERRWEKIQKKISDMQSSESGSGGGGTTAGGGSGGGEGGSVGERLKRMERLVNKRDKRSIRGDRKYVVTRRGGGGQEVRSKKGVKQSGLTVAVDKRLKKDKRGAKIAAKRGKQKKTTANKRKRHI